MLVLTTLTVLLIFITGDVKCECKANKQKKVQLRNEIFCNYDPLERPVLNHKDTINVTIQILLKNIDYAQEEAGLSLNFWLTVTWTDGILNWNPESYDNIKNLIVSNNLLWNPDLSVYNRLEQVGSASMIDSGHCILKHTGLITCVSPNNHEILCQPNLKYFPFDKQVCKMILGSWVHEGEELKILTATPAVSLVDFSDMGEWKLNFINVTSFSGEYECCPNSTFPYLEYSFVIARHSGVFTAMAIVPAITMFTLTFLAFFMEIHGQERMYVILTNIILHILNCQFFAWSLPISGPETPLIMKFARDSLIMTTFLSVLTIFLRKLMQWNMDSPKWIATATEYAIKNRVMQVIFMFDGNPKNAARRLGDDDARNIVENDQTTSSTNQDWKVLANALNRVTLILYMIIYCVMCIAFLP